MYHNFTHTETTLLRFSKVQISPYCSRSFTRIKFSTYHVSPDCKLIKRKSFFSNLTCFFYLILQMFSCSVGGPAVEADSWPSRRGRSFKSFVQGLRPLFRSSWLMSGRVTEHRVETNRRITRVIFGLSRGYWEESGGTLGGNTFNIYFVKVRPKFGHTEVVRPRDWGWDPCYLVPGRGLARAPSKVLFLRLDPILRKSPTVTKGGIAGGRVLTPLKHPRCHVFYV